MREKAMGENFFVDRLEDALNQAKEVLAIKAKEYVRNYDRMHNFNMGAMKKGKIREEIIADFRLKHEISVDDIRNDLSKGIIPSKELVEEKFGDIINYYLLEKISILHKIDEANPSDVRNVFKEIKNEEQRNSSKRNTQDSI